MEISIKSLLLVVVMSLLVGGTGLAQAAPPSFSITISAPQSIVKVGSKIKVDITVTNISKEAIDFAHRDLENGEFNFDFDLRDAQGAPPRETKYFLAVRGKDQGPGPQIVIVDSFGWTRLKPGETLKASADLSTLFDLQPGKYTVQLRRPDQGSGPFADGSGRIAKSNKIMLTVTP